MNLFYNLGAKKFFLIMTQSISINSHKSTSQLKNISFAKNAVSKIKTEETLGKKGLHTYHKKLKSLIHKDNSLK